MNMKLVAIGLAISVMALTGYAEEQKSGVLDGTWVLVSGEVEGKALGEAEIEGGKLVIKGEKWTLTMGDGEPSSGTQKLDSAKKPKTIDVVATSGANKGDAYVGIYDHTGDEFRVALAQPGKPRPESLTAKTGPAQWLHLWKRVKE
jgi:uncharacterized protein (TIGR03067 family)